MYTYKIYMYVCITHCVCHTPLSLAHSFARSFSYNSESCYECLVHHRAPFACPQCSSDRLKKKETPARCRRGCRAPLVGILSIDRVSDLLAASTSLLTSGIVEATMAMTTWSVVVDGKISTFSYRSARLFFLFCHFSHRLSSINQVRALARVAFERSMNP